ncbi:MAG: hypothetical protein O3A50_01240 [Planctomycetota bacterium]|nr:hypothetical protein [Planctomycetota bacterium]
MPLLLSFLPCASLSAQQVFSYGDDNVLPTVTPQGADHATVAVNSYGDVYVAWQGTWSGNTHMVEGMLMQYTGNDQWEFDANNLHILGDMSLHLISQDESCSKPDVVALPDGSFSVAWHRIDRSGLGLSRLEISRIQVRDAQGNLHTTPVIDRRAIGVGFTADSAIISGFAGIMVDLVDLEDGSVAAVYAHETSSVSQPNGDVHREYDLRLTRIDWDLAPGTPGFISAPVTLVSNLPIDNTLAYPLNGGQVLPDIEIDDNQDLIVAYEEFWLDGHGGVSGQTLGQIVVKRFAGFGAVVPFQLLDTDTFTNHFRRHQRRPNLATSRLDTQNTVSMTWVDDEVVLWKSNSILSRQITYSTPGASTVDNLYWENSVFHEDTHATIVHGPQHQRYTLGARFLINSVKILLGHSTQTDMVVVPTAVTTSKRPAAQLVEFPAGSGQFNLFMCYEGSDSGNPQNFLVHLVVFRVP